MIKYHKFEMFVFMFNVLLLSQVHSRAVNISSSWVLPEEGFPVFYRYFRDRISWYEADAVCQFHHGNLVTVDSAAQYDGVRAFLKELDIDNNIWIGLIRNNPEGEFTWTDYRQLSIDRYWAEPLPATATPLCVSADPAKDFRWRAMNCGGPEVAAFICELQIPQWALPCLVQSLPALTVIYSPEEAVLHLSSDCGVGEMSGAKQVTCKGEADRENLIKQLSCGMSDNDFSYNGVSRPPVSLNTPTSMFKTAASDTSSASGIKPYTVTSAGNTIDQEESTQARSRRETVGSSTIVHSIPEGSSTVPTTKLIKKDIDKLEESGRKVIEHSDRLSTDMITDSPKTDSTEPPSTVSTNQIFYTESHGFKSPMVHDKLEDKKIIWSEIENKDQPTQTDRFIPPMLLVKSKFSQEIKIKNVGSTDTSVTNVNSVEKGGENVTKAEQSTKLAPDVENHNNLLNEHVYTIVENGTIVDILELNETGLSDSKIDTTDANPILEKGLANNIVVEDKEKHLKPSNIPTDDHQIIDFVITEPTILESIATAKAFRASTIPDKIVEHETPSPKDQDVHYYSNVNKEAPSVIDPKIKVKVLNSNISTTNSESEIIENIPGKGYALDENYKVRTVGKPTTKPNIEVMESGTQKTVTDKSPNTKITDKPNTLNTSDDQKIIINDKNEPFIIEEKVFDLNSENATKFLEELSNGKVNVPSAFVSEISPQEPEGVLQQADIEPSEPIEPEPAPLHKPNRRRILQKPPHTSYMKRVLG